MNPAQLTGESLDIYRVLRAVIEGKNSYNVRRAIEAVEWALANECVVKEGSAKYDGIEQSMASAASTVPDEIKKKTLLPCVGGIYGNIG